MDKGSQAVRGSSAVMSIRTGLFGKKAVGPHRENQSVVEAKKHSGVIQKARVLEDLAEKKDSFDIHKAPIGKGVLPCLMPNCTYEGPVEDYCKDVPVNGRYDFRCPRCHYLNGHIDVEILMRPDINPGSLRSRLRASLENREYDELHLRGLDLKRTGSYVDYRKERRNKKDL
jgi:hypothetical protein